MRKFSFTIIASGLDHQADDFEDRFFEAGCDDATITIQKGAIILEFDREAKNLSHALASAMRDVEKAGARVEHVEPDHLVNLSDIAVRAGVTRAAASLYATGQRGSDFPSPVARVTTDSALWDWEEVARWLYRHRRLSMDDLLRARLVRAANVEIARRLKSRSRVFGRVRRLNVTVISNRGTD
jgi:Asp-tRNA(Asn)/Glu-tRNA(Gln) amidotransferase A subunit family amidase